MDRDGENEKQMKTRAVLFVISAMAHIQLPAASMRTLVKSEQRLAETKSLLAIGK